MRVDHITGRYGLHSVVGHAGTGKSTMFGAAKEAWERKAIGSRQPRGSFRHLRYGRAQSHRPRLCCDHSQEQGVTVDRAPILALRTWIAMPFMSGLSRHRDQADLPYSPEESGDMFATFGRHSYTGAILKAKGIFYHRGTRPAE